MRIQLTLTRLRHLLVDSFDRQVIVPEAAVAKVSVMIQRAAPIPRTDVIMLHMHIRGYHAITEIVSLYIYISGLERGNRMDDLINSIPKFTLH